jgi:hypothetical protein
MKDIRNIHTAITCAQISVTLVSLSVSSLGVVIQHPILVFFWYMALSAIASILATSFVIGVALLLNRIIHPRSSRGGPRGRHSWPSRPRSAQA